MPKTIWPKYFSDILPKTLENRFSVKAGTPNKRQKSVINFVEKPIRHHTLLMDLDMYLVEAAEHLISLLAHSLYMFIMYFLVNIFFRLIQHERN